MLPCSASSEFLLCSSPAAEVRSVHQGGTKRSSSKVDGSRRTRTELFLFLPESPTSISHIMGNTFPTPNASLKYIHPTPHFHRLLYFAISALLSLYFLHLKNHKTK